MDNRQVTFTLRPPKPLFSLYNLARLGFFLFGIPKNSFGSVDVTKQCNLRCEHCYFFEQEHSSELSLEQWREKFESMGGGRVALLPVRMGGGRAAPSSAAR